MRGLASRWYLEPAAALTEREKIFDRSWQFVCHGSDLPAAGTAIRFDCAGRSAVVMRGRDGQLHGFRNSCRHRGSRLVDGDAHTGLAFCVDARLRCPYHGWTYDETGSLVSVPVLQEYATLDAASTSLEPVHVAEWRGLVFVAFELPAIPLGRGIETTAEDADGISTSHALRRLGEPRIHPLRADWKLACEHLLDLSHLTVARPALKPRIFDAQPFAPCGELAIRTVRGMEASRDSAAWPVRMYDRHLPVTARRRLTAVFVWPNLLLQFMPDQLAVTQVLPAATGVCAIREVSYGLPDASRELRIARYAAARVRRRAREHDAKILERLQDGLGSAAADHAAPLANAETGLHWFVEQWRASGAGGVGKPVRRARLRSPAPVPS